MKKVNIGLIGYGTIGSGVVETLRKKGKFIREQAALDIVIKKICDKSPTALKKAKASKAILTRNPEDILRDPEIDIVVELIGGINEAKKIITKAMNSKKHIVTANKALLATHGQEIFKLADKNGVLIRFDASVGGGIPIIKAFREGFISNRIDAIYAIINGTSNFILTKMADERYDFQKALREAQKGGFAERDPELDINGMDSAHKLAVLSLVGFKFSVDLKDIYVEGIKDIEASDIEYTEELGYTIKLLAIAKRVKEELEVRVHPTLLPSRYVLSKVESVYNAILVRGDLIGRSLFYGKGAGRYPTASAVMSDIVDIGKSLDTEVADNLLTPDSKNEIIRVKKMGEIKTRYYIRLAAIDKPGVLAKVSGILARHNISIATVTQKERRASQVVPIVMMTHTAKESDMQKAIKQIGNLNVIKHKPVRIRVED